MLVALQNTIDIQSLSVQEGATPAKPLMMMARNLNLLALLPQTLLAKPIQIYQNDGRFFQTRQSGGPFKRIKNV